MPVKLQYQYHCSVHVALILEETQYQNPSKIRTNTTVVPYVFEVGRFRLTRTSESSGELSIYHLSLAYHSPSFLPRRASRRPVPHAYVWFAAHIAHRIVLFHVEVFSSSVVLVLVLTETWTRHISIDCTTDSDGPHDATSESVLYEIGANLSS